MAHNNRSHRVPAQGRLNLNAAACTTDEERFKLGELMHRENLRVLAPYLQRKGIFRIHLSETCEVIGIYRSVGPPQPGVFSFKMNGEGTEPKAGSFDRLAKPQEKYATALMEDLTKVCRARELAQQHVAMHAAIGPEQARVAEMEAEKHLADIATRVSEIHIPLGKTELAARRKEAEMAQLEKQAAWIAGEKQEALDLMGGDLSMEEHLALMEKEEAKAKAKREKKARQKARKLAEKELKQQQLEQVQQL